jgi:hypothetical protein
MRSGGCRQLRAFLKACLQRNKKPRLVARLAEVGGPSKPMTPAELAGEPGIAGSSSPL